MKNILIFCILLTLSGITLAQEIPLKSNSKEGAASRADQGINTSINEGEEKLTLPDCPKLYNEIENDLVNSNYCGQDSDCKTMGLGGRLIKFGCFHFVNKDVDTEKIYEKMTKYYQKCDQAIDKCAPAPRSICINKKCTYAGEENE